MNVEDFLMHVRACKGYTNVTGSQKIFTWTNPEHTKKTIGKECKCTCPKCGFDCEEKVIIKFKEPVRNLTIFQAGMFYCIFLMKKKPHDYAQYHKCVAGKRFIENIESITV